MFFGFGNFLKIATLLSKVFAAEKLMLKIYKF
jgi:hypothetical protein